MNLTNSADNISSGAYKSRSVRQTSPAYNGTQSSLFSQHPVFIAVLSYFNSDNILTPHAGESFNIIHAAIN
jgi:hypothetical protein